MDGRVVGHREDRGLPHRPLGSRHRAVSILFPTSHLVSYMLGSSPSLPPWIIHCASSRLVGGRLAYPWPYFILGFAQREGNPTTCVRDGGSAAFIPWSADNSVFPSTPYERPEKCVGRT